MVDGEQTFPTLPKGLLIMAFNNGEGLIRWHFKLDSDPEDMIVTLGIARTNAPGEAALSAIFDSYVDNILEHLADVYVFRGIGISGRTSGGVDYDVELFSNAVGTDTLEPLTQNCALLVQKRTGLAGRANRGRMYLPGLLAQDNVSPNGQIDPTSLGELQTSFTAWYDDLLVEASTGITDLLVLHPVGAGTVITAFVVDDVLATQRRRLR